MKKLYTESSLEKCIETASEGLGISKESLKYEIVEQKKSLFRKKVTIQVELEDEMKIERKKDDENYNLEKLEIIDKDLKSSNEIEEYVEINENDGTVSIIQGKIVVTNPKEGGDPARIILKDKNIKVIVDGVELSGQKSVFEESNIVVIFEETKATRELNISLNNNKLEAYASVTYTPQNIYKLKDKNKSKKLTLEVEVESEIHPPKFNESEVKQELANNNVVYGIIEENLKKCVEGCREKILIAKGQPVIDGEDDFIEIKFKLEEALRQLQEDKGGNVDFKSIGAVEAVHKGDILAIRNPGNDGQDGCDVTGKIIKYKIGKKIKIKVGNGAAIKDGDIVVADIDGKPCVKSNVFYVYPVHDIKGDVDLKTGNIRFIGDVIVYGSVKEGMEIDSGNLVDIAKDVERAVIRARGDIIIKGNVIAGKIYGGGDDVEKLKALNNIEQLREILGNLVSAVEEIKKYNLLGENKKDGEIIKILIENKFKMLPKICFYVIASLNMQKEDYAEEELVVLLKSKLLGMGPINIKHYAELDGIISCIKDKLKSLKATLALPVSVKLAYSQDSIIQSSGDVVMLGKGEYISDITANGNIYFIQDKSVARGGRLKAKNEIKCKVVGSTAGVSTRIEVEKEGHIWVDVAYQNTIFTVGTREFMLDMPSKNVHAYLDESGDIVVDRLKL
ncbi:flagellar assembly protein A [Clostridium sp. OS1-26]|uniref:DUF342 domain-containing protein n=1 Tax=Clostridium sp. OS1-26 TaxID=3070681 RepID=UPI0027DEE6F3|nr:flagellar assembly protein A [Clostridium sp. OS1-26]WML35520.1 FapA family protein [Clostridium sp. OS1-26]